MKPHKHAEIIKAWADGADIQSKILGGNWSDCSTPRWYEETEYRVKPELDQISYLLLNYPHKHTWFESNQPAEHDCIKIIRDHKTGKLKSAEAL